MRIIALVVALLVAKAASTLVVAQEARPVPCFDCDGGGRAACASCPRAPSALPCDRCSRRGSVNCNVCDGNKTTKCTDCGGTGLTQRKRPVEREKPNGTKYKEFVTYNVVCADCDGKKKRSCTTCSGAGSFKCRDCGGTGSLKAPPPPLCVSCDGSKFVACRSCVGSGEARHVALVDVRRVVRRIARTDLTDLARQVAAEEVRGQIGYVSFLLEEAGDGCYLRGPTGDVLATCMFPSSMKQKLATISKYATVEVVGRIQSVDAENAVLTNCVILNP